jgi:hypothetical protein
MAGAARRLLAGQCDITLHGSTQEFAGRQEAFGVDLPADFERRESGRLR